MNRIRALTMCVLAAAALLASGTRANAQGFRGGLIGPPPANVIPVNVSGGFLYNGNIGFTGNAFQLPIAALYPPLAPQNPNLNPRTVTFIPNVNTSYLGGIAGQGGQIGQIGQIGQFGQFGQGGQIGQIGQIGQGGQIGQIGQIGGGQFGGGQFGGGQFGQIGGGQFGAGGKGGGIGGGQFGIGGGQFGSRYGI